MKKVVQLPSLRSHCLRFVLSLCLLTVVIGESYTQTLFEAPGDRKIVETETSLLVFDPMVVRGNATSLTLIQKTALPASVLTLTLKDERGRIVSSSKSHLQTISGLSIYSFDIGLPALSTFSILEPIFETPQPGNGKIGIPPGLRIRVVDRNYRSETIALNPSMTNLRASPDPRKDAESAAYTKLLDITDPSHRVSDNDERMHPFMDIRRTSFFGDRRIYAYSNGTSESSMHAGFDYGGNKRPVYAPIAGEIVFAGPRIVTGNTVIIALAPGVYAICFHMDTISVHKGEKVQSGRIIGTSGATGLVTGPHLHWEIRVASTAAEGEFLLESRNIDTKGLARILSLPVYP